MKELELRPSLPHENGVNVETESGHMTLPALLANACSSENAVWVLDSQLQNAWNNSAYAQLDSAFGINSIMVDELAEISQSSEDTGYVADSISTLLRKKLEALEVQCNVRGWEIQAGSNEHWIALSISEIDLERAYPTNEEHNGSIYRTPAVPATRRRDIAVNSAAIYLELCPDLVIRDVSNRFCQSSGYQAAELIGKKIHECFNESIPRDVLTQLGDLDQANSSSECECRFESKKGTKFVAELVINRSVCQESGSVSYFAIGLDVTTRRICENDLDMLRTALNEHVGISIVDRAGTIIETNQGLCRLTGYSREQLIGQPISVFDSSIYAERFWYEIGKRISEGHIWRGEVCDRHADGSDCWTDCTIVPFKDVDGQVVRYVCIRFGINEVRLNREALASAQELLEQTGQLAKIGGWELDLETKLFQWSKELFRIHEMPQTNRVSLEQVINSIEEQAQQEYRDAIDDAVLFGAFWDLELPIRTEKGHLRWIRSIGLPQMRDGECHKLWGATQDVTEQHEANDKLSELASRLKTATEGAMVGIWDYQLDSGNHYWDRITFELHDVSASTQLAISDVLTKIVLPEDLAVLNEVLTDAPETLHGFDVEYRIRDKEGKTRFIQSTCTYEKTDFGAGRVVGVCRDVTEARLAEQRLNQAMRISRIGLWDWHFGTRTGSCSDTLYLMLGYSADRTRFDFESREDWMHPDDVVAVRRALQDHLDGITPVYRSEHRLKCSDGSWRWVMDIGEVIERDAEQQPLSMIGVHIDIQELKELSSRLELTISSAEAGVWEWDIANGLLETNKYYHSMLGEDYSYETLPIAALEDRIHESDHQLRLDALQECFQHEGSAYDVELRILCADGCYKWIRCTGLVTERDEDGNPLRMIGQHMDVDSQRRALEDIEALNTKLAEKVRVAKQLAVKAEAASKAKSDFLANMSHEIRTPMAAILGFAENLSETVHRPENINAVETIRRNGEHLLGVLNDILDLSKIEAGRLEIEQIRFSLPDLLSELRSLMQVRADAKGLKWDVAIEGEIPTEILTDPTRLRQILINIASNGIKFTEVGHVRATCRVEKIAQQQAKLLISIEDSGIGMNAAQLSQLFQAFGQADTSMARRFGGTGLGLAISKRFAELLSGDITVTSEPDKGSKFLLSIPIEIPLNHKTTDELAKANQDESNHAAILAKPDPLSGVRILLVEDGPDNQKLISFLLKKAGADVTIKENGLEGKSEALQALEAGEPYDIILTDMQMPVMDGYTATTLLREANYTGCIVALTAHAMNGDREKCISAGCDDFTTKPVDRAKLISLLSQYADLARMKRFHVETEGVGE